jgi:hypothetical protein
MALKPETARDYALDRFLASPEAAFGHEWLDSEGHGVADRGRAVEVRLTKRIGRGLLTIRIPLEQALQLGLIRAETA